MKPTLLLLVGMFYLFVGLPSLQARELHVAPPQLPAGPEADGSRERPYPTLQEAVNQIEPGDTVLIHAGTYLLHRPVRLGAGGRPDAWVTIKALGNGEVILDGARIPYTKELRLRLGSTGVLNVEGPSYVRIEGLVIRHSPAVGLFVRGPSHHVEITNCRIEHTYSSGIGIWNTHDVRVIRNVVVGANNPHRREVGTPEPVQTPHEAITLAGVSDFEVAENRVYDGWKEGIDVKETSRRGRVHHNVVTGMKRQGLYADAWFGLLEDVTFDHNYVADCEWGIVLSCEGYDSFMKSIHIHHNVLVDNRGSGVYFGRWGLEGPRTGIVIAHNTLWRNGTVDHWSGATGGIDMRSASVFDVLVINNLVVDSGAYGIGSVRTPDQREPKLRLDVRVRSNLVHPWKDLAVPRPQVDERYGESRAIRGTETILAHPLWRDPASGNFELRADSPARGAAVPLDLPYAEPFPDLGADPAVAKLPDELK